MWRGAARSGYADILNHWQILEHCPNGPDNTLVSPVNGPSTIQSRRRHSSSSDSSSHSTDYIYSNDRRNEVEYKLYGYEFCWTRTILYHVIALIPFLGLPHLLALWFPTIRALRYKKCDLANCTIVLLRNNLDLLQLHRVRQVNTDVLNRWQSSDDPLAQTYGGDTVNNTAGCFDFEKIRYIYNREEAKFVRLRMPHEDKTIKYICSDNRRNFHEGKRHLYNDLYGFNEIEVDVKSYWALFTEEIINPFYLFQIFSITLWSLDDYYYYAACVFILSAISIGTSLYQTRRQSLTLRDLVNGSRPEVVITRNYSHTGQIDTFRLAPCDMIEIQNGILPCDCLLVEGWCIVNECMLTGESVPVRKVAVDTTDEQKFLDHRHKSSILYAGTQVITIRGGNGAPVIARVLNVGFYTAQGQLIKSIMFPKPIGFKFYRDSMRFVVVLFCLAVFGMYYSVRLYLKRNQDIKTMIFGTLDVITIIVPPALPMAMTAGTIYSQNRLKQEGIFCISPPQINVCGKINLCCFDKTGTLTEDGMTYLGHLALDPQLHKIRETMKFRRPENLFSKLLQCMATCHSLIVDNGDVVGDPLDVEMFINTDWLLTDSIYPGMPTASRSVTPKSEWEKGTNVDLPYAIGIHKDFEFTSERQSMSVIVSILGHENFIVFAKGAPEKIRGSLVDIPDNYSSVLSQHAQSGYRVLALAYKEYGPKVKLTDLLKKKRDELESNLSFLGFVVFQNSLKPETRETITDLKKAAIRIAMATGDNILTAMSVARESGIVDPDEMIYELEFKENWNVVRARLSGPTPRQRQQPEETVAEMDHFCHHFALDGQTWEALRKQKPKLIPWILCRCTIFARFRPEQKSELVQSFQDIDYIVAMCGDGANDCTALKAANIGVSLSQAEASVAAPFTYNKQNIKCVKHLALEGRCALVTSFAIFKYMILYSVIQFCTVLILYTYCTTLGNFQFLFIDLVITASIAFSMGMQEPMAELGIKRPSSSLISPYNVIPLVIQIITCICLQLGVTMLLTEQSWYPDSDVEQRCLHNDTLGWRMPLHGGLGSGEKPIVCWENTVVFLTSCFQYLVLGLVYSKGKPFRKPFYTNVTFVAIFVTLTTFTLILLLQPPEPLANFFELQNISDSTAEENIFRYYLLICPCVHILAAMVIEFGMAERRWLKTVCHFLTRKSRPRNKFRDLSNRFDFSEPWLEFVNPPLLQIWSRRVSD